MKQILVIGNTELELYKNRVAKEESDKSKNVCFVSTQSFISELADETTEYIHVTNWKTSENFVAAYLDDAKEHNKPVREIYVSTIEQAINHCNEEIKSSPESNTKSILYFQLKNWLTELKTFKDKIIGE